VGRAGCSDREAHNEEDAVAEPPHASRVRIDEVEVAELLGSRRACDQVAIEVTRGHGEALRDGGLAKRRPRSSRRRVRDGPRENHSIT